MRIEVTKIQNSGRIDYYHCRCMEEADRLYLRGLSASFRPAGCEGAWRMLWKGGCQVQGQSDGWVGWCYTTCWCKGVAKGVKGGRRPKKEQNYGCEHRKLLSSWENNRYQPIMMCWEIRRAGSCQAQHPAPLRACVLSRPSTITGPDLPVPCTLSYPLQNYRKRDW